MEALIEVFDLSITYRLADANRIAAVDGLSLEVRRGEVVGILGESGCGKSTLATATLRLLPGALHRPAPNSCASMLRCKLTIDRRSVAGKCSLVLRILAKIGIFLQMDVVNDLFNRLTFILERHDLFVNVIQIVTKTP